VEKTYKSLVDSVHKMDGEDGYVDLFLIHTANGGSKDRKEMYSALEKLLEAGKTRSIGVSNWGIGHIEELKSFAKVWPPHVNQIEVRPFPMRCLVEAEICGSCMSFPSSEKSFIIANKTVLWWKLIVLLYAI